MSVEIKPKFIYLYFIRPSANIVSWLPTRSTEFSRMFVANGSFGTEDGEWEGAQRSGWSRRSCRPW